MNKLRDIFCMSEGQTEKLKKYIQQLTKESIDRRNQEVELVKESDVLYCSEPFRSFPGDCTSCSSYYDPNRGFITGGYCMLHKIGCGNGLTCADNDSKLNDGWKEFEKIRSRI